MIVSYENQLKQASLSATNEDINRPVTNIIHNFLELAFYADTTNTEITAVFDEVCNIDHIAFDYHNLDNMTIEFYDPLDNLLHTEVISVEEDCNFHTFTKVNNIKTVIISVDTYASLLYIGGISMGEYFEFPRFRQSLRGEVKLFSTLNVSGGGQASGNAKQKRNGYSLDFVNIANEDRLAIEDYLEYVQTSMPHFIMFYEDGDDYFKPFYGCMTTNNIPIPKRRLSNWEWDFSLSYQEVR